MWRSAMILAGSLLLAAGCGAHSTAPLDGPRKPVPAEDAAAASRPSFLIEAGLSTEPRPAALQWGVPCGGFQMAAWYRADSRSIACLVKYVGETDILVAASWLGYWETVGLYALSPREPGNLRRIGRREGTARAYRGMGPMFGREPTTPGTELFSGNRFPGVDLRTAQGKKLYRDFTFAVPLMDFAWPPDIRDDNGDVCLVVTASVAAKPVKDDARHGDTVIISNAVTVPLYEAVHSQVPVAQAPARQRDR
ncbi:MAG: hypothetical protein JW909_05375 [Planctomycetes bacterium]|nr:hypothetical protein [Planctomycetota bacterium]